MSLDLRLFELLSHKKTLVSEITGYYIPVHTRLDSNFIPMDP